MLVIFGYQRGRLRNKRASRMLEIWRRCLQMNTWKVELTPGCPYCHHVPTLNHSEVQTDNTLFPGNLKLGEQFLWGNFRLLPEKEPTQSTVQVCSLAESVQATSDPEGYFVGLMSQGLTWVLKRSPTSRQTQLLDTLYTHKKKSH